MSGDQQIRSHASFIWSVADKLRGVYKQSEYGRVILLMVPGADDIQLYQPTHKLAYNL